ncbi:hypothetical protein B0T17DRAFT_545444, partial [Bombardia bombarda]
MLKGHQPGLSQDTYLYHPLHRAFRLERRHMSHISPRIDTASLHRYLYPQLYTDEVHGQ